MRAEILDHDAMDVATPVEFVRGIESEAWDILPDGSAVIAVEQRPQPRLRIILGAARLFPGR